MNNDYTKTGDPTIDNINLNRAASAISGNDPYAGAGATSLSASAGLGNTSITSSNLAPATPINLPTPAVPTTANGVAGKSQAIIDQQAVQSQITADATSKQAQADTQKGVIGGLMDKITGLQTTRSTAEGDINTPGTPAYLKEVARKASNALDISSKAQLSELAAVDGQGLTDVQKNSAKAEINRKYASSQADLQLSYHLANSDYTAAEDTLNTKFQLDLQPLQTQLTYQTSVYDDIKGDLTAAEDRQWSTLIDNSKTELATETANKKEVSDIFSKLQENNPQALKNNPQLGVQLANAKDGVEASQILATSGISLADQTDVAYKQAQTAKLIADARATGSSTVGIVNDQGNTVSIPTNVAPYYNTSNSGVGYIDASSLEGTAAEKTQIINDAQRAGLKVITNKNTAADLVNIKDANTKLDTISTLMTGIDQPNAVSRALYGAGLTKLAVLGETNPQQAAAGALQSVGLDILKAISGVQGFRGNQTAIQQVTEHLPTIYDTDAVVQQKIAYVRQLISAREDAAVGKPTSDNGATAVKGSSALVNGHNYVYDGTQWVLQ